jgi:hypothetical protein
MRLIGIALLMILTTSCQTRLVCKELKKNEIKPLEKCSISFKLQRCRCRMFDLNTWTTLGEATNHPLDYCDGISGYRITDEAEEIRPKVKAMSRLKENLCQ